MSDNKRYETTTFAPSGPQLPTVAAPTVGVIDPQALVRAGLKANTEMVDGFIRSITPPPPPIDGQVVGSYSTPAESAGRTERYKFSIGAIVAIAAVIAGGIILLAYNAHVIDEIGGVAAWLALTGVIAAGFVTWLQTQDFRHSAEGIAHAREGYQAVVQQTDADSRRILAEAYAYAIKRQADSAADGQAAQTQLTLSEMRRLAAPQAEAPQRPQLLAWQPASYAGAEDDGPIYAHRVTDPDCAQSPISPPQSPGGAGDPLLSAVLSFVASLYDDGADANGLILKRLPWSLRGEFTAGQRDQVLAVLDRINPPLIELRAGNRAYLQRRDYPSKFAALGAINRVWD